MKISYKFLTILLLIFTFSCGSKKKIADKKTSTYERQAETANYPGLNKVERYIATYAPIAQQEMQLYNIPASITLAQGILESGAGDSRLSLKANNHFGIKCHGWEGGSIFHDDDRRDECFRKYKDPKYSYRDHSLFLTERKRYAGLFELDMEDYKGWAKGLRKAGYATDRKYPDKLISIIERYQLYLYDAQVLGKDVVFADNQVRSSERHIVQKGDTLYSIGKQYNLSVEQLQQFNNLRDSTIGIGQILYLEP